MVQSAPSVSISYDARNTGVFNDIVLNHTPLHPITLLVPLWWNGILFSSSVFLPRSEKNGIDFSGTE